MVPNEVAPVVLEVEYPEKLSRRHLLLKSFFGWIYAGIPHWIILLFFAIAVQAITIAAFFIVLFTRRYPRGLFDLVVGYHRWSYRVAAYLSYYMLDNYPPFSMDDDPLNPVSLHVEYPESLSRVHVLFKFFLGWLYAGIPHGIILLLYFIAVIFALFFSWWAILFTGRYPRSMFGFVLGFLRWSFRVEAYLSLLRDEYPPFNGRP